MLHFKETWIFSAYFRKLLSWKSFQWEPSFLSKHTDGPADRQTERHDETSGHFSQFCESAWKGFLIFIENLTCESPKDLEKYTWETKRQGHTSREIDESADCDSAATSEVDKDAVREF